ncbi:MAG: ubiquinone biosynthesis protein [Planctomycetota bacterium]|jgi:ubiquinone biosynthesis protein
MLLDVLIAAEDLGRLQEITRILIQSGFEDIAQRMGLLGLLQRAGRIMRLERADQITSGGTPERARLALEALGPTFVKLGQVMASRADLMPPEWIEEFSKLQSQVASVPWEELRPQLEKDLGAAPETVFSDLEIEPLAAGSIGQVHRASLPDGREVVLKIRRPGISKKIAADLRLLERLADILERELTEFRRFRPTMVVRQFARSLKAELDFSIEARNTQLAAVHMESLPDIVIPEVFTEYGCKRLLVMEFIKGHSADAWVRGDRREEFDGAHVASVGAESILRMVFIDGFYHADPHPGNLMLLPLGQIALLDFGMVGRLSETRRQQFTLLLAAIIDRDEEGLVDTLLEWSDGEDSDIELLVQDCNDFLDRYTARELKNLNVSAMLQDISRIVRENNLILPADVAGLIKVFLTLEGLGRRLDPDFSLDEHIEPIARRMMREMASPRRIVARNWRDVRRLAVSLPRDIRKVIQRLRRTGFKIELDLKRLDDFGRQLDRSANRITVGLITSALIVGTSIAMTIDSGPTIFGLPVLGFFGFGFSFTIGLMLLWSILRSGNR